MSPGCNLIVVEEYDASSIACRIKLIGLLFELIFDEANQEKK